ncbi:hypothetical protein KSD_10200 [Ktedonobacter sp. SOSP1-85]|uniref:Uncharacterized protein n=1 Tax=Ktedonobacter robiniae TaxID=2778365 RepID=A0ABQ3URQ8_9CHLR|nr:hypothetical protein KSB_36050 [Ktedonobacter robiniae]GHO73249.1 hypothetical protein KSD_10200 [Ktedonobacter sp. SOSP1-85]
MCYVCSTLIGMRLAVIESRKNNLVRSVLESNHQAPNIHTTWQKGFVWFKS